MILDHGGACPHNHDLRGAGVYGPLKHSGVNARVGVLLLFMCMCMWGWCVSSHGGVSEMVLRYSPGLFRLLGVLRDWSSLELQCVELADCAL